jgi:hypothetical protein
VVDHYAKLGFAKIDEEQSGMTRWELALENAQAISELMKIISHGFATQQESLA